MKYRASVCGLADRGDHVRVTLNNVRQKGAAYWREYSAAIDVDMLPSAAKAFYIGRAVTIEVKPT